MARTLGPAGQRQRSCPRHEIRAFLALAGKRERRAYRFGNSPGMPAGRRQPRPRPDGAGGRDERRPRAAHGAFGERLARPLPPLPARGRAGARRTAHEINLPALLPALTHYSGTGPFLTCGMVSIRNPETGLVERSLCRMQVRGRTGSGGVSDRPLLRAATPVREQANAGRPPRVGRHPRLRTSHPAERDPWPPSRKWTSSRMAGGVRGEAVDVVLSPLQPGRGARTGRVPDRGVLEVPGEYDGPMGESSGYTRATR